MFRRYWKTLKAIVIIAIILVCLPHSILPRQNSSSGMDDLSDYIKQNETEKRLPEFKDNEEALKIKLAHLEIINRSRKKFRAEPVKLDILASRVANRMSREAAENKYTGHWNMEGEKPYHRYAFAGGNDHVSENAFGEWTTGKYDISPSVISEMMKKGHESFMAEKAPSDGHKKTIIDKAHNYVGIGYFLSENQFRYYEEFIDRYFEFGKVTTELKVNEQGYLNFKSDGKNFPYFLIIYREDFPEPLTVSQLNRKGSYSDFTSQEYLKMPAWDILKFKKGVEYSIPLQFNREGLYYVHIYADRNEITKPGKLDTEGKIVGSGIVIKVRN